ncbi:MAG: cell division protein ZapA [Clostridia bacterium]|nr:cell division protein ZapA [Clostridia bacterium]
MEKKKVKVLINGAEYTLVTAEPAEYVQRVAVKVDKTLSEISVANPRLSTAMLGMLTSINLADELLRLEDSADNLRKQIAEYSKSEIQLSTQVSEKTARIETLEKLVQEIQIELAKSSARNGY